MLVFFFVLESDASKQSCCHPIPSSSTSPCPSSSTTSSPFTSPVAKRPRVNACKILRSGTDLRKLYPINENPNGVIGWDLPGETQVFQVVLPEGPTQYTRNGWFAYDRGSIGLVCHNQLCKGSENQSIYVSHFKSKPPHSSLHLPAGSHSPSVCKYHYTMYPSSSSLSLSTNSIRCIISYPTSHYCCSFCNASIINSTSSTSSSY